MSSVLRLRLGVTGYLSEYENNPINKRVDSVDAPPAFGGYSGVEIITGDNTSVFSGSRVGRVFTVTNEWGTQEQADNILASLIGYQYQPVVANGAYLSPAAELGDTITVNGVHTGIYAINKSLLPNSTSDVKAPQDEEIDHEFPYEPQSDRAYKREFAETRASITQTSEAIAAEVVRATSAESSLSSRLELTATQIRAEVVANSGGDNSSFGWSLTSDGFYLYSGGQNVMTVNRDGLEVKGKITATSGYIGNGSSGFAITANAIYNGVTGMSDTAHSGVYMGTDGIVCGQGKFKVTNGGAVTASNLTITGGSITIGSNFSVGSTGNVRANSMTLSGTLTVGGSTISADNLRLGAERANGGYSSWNGTTNSWNRATTRNSSGYPDYFHANIILGDYLSTSHTFVCPGLQVDGDQVSWKSKTVVTGVTPRTSNLYAYVSSTATTRVRMTYVYDVTPSTVTIYYLGR